MEVFLPQIRAVFATVCRNRKRTEAWCFQDFKSSFATSYHFCVWSWVSHSARPTPASGCAWALQQLLAMDVLDAEGLDDEAVREEKTEGKLTNGTFNIDIKQRDGDGCENDADF